MKLDNFMMGGWRMAVSSEGEKTVLRFWDERKRFIPEPHGSPGIVQLSPRGGKFPLGTFHGAIWPMPRMVAAKDISARENLKFSVDTLHTKKMSD